MDESGFYVSFNSISVISEGYKGEHERLCAMKRLLGTSTIYYRYVLDRDRILKCLERDRGISGMGKVFKLWVEQKVKR